MGPSKSTSSSMRISIPRIGNFILLYFLVVELTIDASNILRRDGFNQATFVLKNVDKKQLYSPYSITTVDETYQCLDICTDHASCKSVNINENTTPLGCELVSRDRNSYNYYTNAPGYKHYDTGKTTLSRWVTRGYGMGRCLVPETLSCEVTTANIILSSDATQCEKPHAYFSYDFDNGVLSHHCTGLPVCPSSDGSGYNVVISSSCPTQSKSSGDSHYYSFRREYSEYMTRGKQVLRLTDNILQTGTSLSSGSINRFYFSDIEPRQANVRVRIKSFGSSSYDLDHALSNIPTSGSSGYGEDFSVVGNMDSYYAISLAALFVAPVTGWYHFALPCRPMCALYHGSSESAKSKILHNDANVASSFMKVTLDTEKARGVYMTQGTRYYLEAVLYDKTNYNEYMALLMKIPGVDDIWRPVTNNYLIKI